MGDKRFAKAQIVVLFHLPECAVSRQADSEAAQTDGKAHDDRICVCGGKHGSHQGSRGNQRGCGGSQSSLQANRDNQGHYEQRDMAADYQGTQNIADAGSGDSSFLPLLL